MSLLKSTLESPSVAIPFRVRLEPYLVESICELSRLVRDKGSQHSDISGLLFGKIEAGVRTVEALKTFVDAGAHSELARRERWERAYKTTLEESKTDPELSEFSVVGWFSFRTSSGLLSSDIVFHNSHFRKPEDLALVVWREGPSQITAELYSKSEDETLSSDDYRWGSVRLSADIRHMHEAVELAMRVKLSDDSYLKTYEDEESASGLNRIKQMAGVASERLMGFLYRRKEEKQLERVRGYIGDGRLPTRGVPGAEEAIPSPQAYFNPYSDVALARSRAAMGEAASPAYSAGIASGAYGEAPAWPGSGSGFGTAPAPARSPEPRMPEPRPEPAAPEPPRYQPMALPPPPLLDLANIGRAPRTRTVMPGEVSGLPMVLRPPTPQKSFPWGWAAVLFVVCSGFVFAFLAMGGLQGDGGRLSQVFQTIFPGGDLNLRVHNEDDRLRLSWNQRNHVVASASDATLQIFDGQQHRDIHLDGQQVADGSVLYRPLTNDVTFRLEVRGEQGAATGSVRVLDGLSGRQAVLDVSAPTTQAPLTPQYGSQAGAPYGAAAAAPPTDAPSILRNGPGVPEPLQQQAANSADPNYAPITETPLPPVSRPAARTTQQPRVQRYETPQTVGELQTPSGAPITGSGSTINGWDTPPTRYKAKTRRSAPVSSPVLSATGYVPPRPVMQVMPNTRAIPSGTLQSRTRVEVQVDVDQHGRVSGAHVVGGGVNDTIASAALSAAKQWTFDPASNNGQRVDSEHTIVFEFRPEQR